MSQKFESLKSLVLGVAIIFVIACDGASHTAKSSPHREALEPACGVSEAGAQPRDGAMGVGPFDCHVTLSKVSYDSPGADDAELLELRIEGLPENVSISFGDCGVQRLELVNGGGATCSAYRSIDLERIAIPKSGYFVLCSTDSRLAANGDCDALGADLSLKNGWLQNGPNDGIRLVGAANQAWSYEGIPNGCPTDDWQDVPQDTGEAIAGQDDILASCPGGFVRMSAIDAPLRAAAACGANEVEAGIQPVDGGRASNPDADSTIHGPTVSPGSIEIKSESIEVPNLSKDGAQLSFDAGKGQTKDAGEESSSIESLAPSCLLGAETSGEPSALCYATVMGLAWAKWRRQRRVTCNQAT
jgi:hypothetical protein